jgi:hypothetical protein
MRSANPNHDLALITLLYDGIQCGWAAPLGFGERRNLEVGASGDILNDSNNLVSTYHFHSTSSGAGHPRRRFALDAHSSD